jgi:hypothetical protein
MAQGAFGSEVRLQERVRSLEPKGAPPCSGKKCHPGATWCVRWENLGSQSRVIVCVVSCAYSCASQRRVDRDWEKGQTRSCWGF